MTKLILLLFFSFMGTASFCQRIERSLVGTAGETYVSSGFQLSYSIGEPVIVPSPSTTFDVVTFPRIFTIGFQQPHVATTGGLVSTNNWVSVYPNPTTGRVRLDIHGNNFQANSVRIYNAIGQEVAIKPFVLVNGSIDLFLDNLPAGVYLIAVTDKTFNNTVATKILKQNK
jgi:Secretion system C-terminal sorting domain